MRWLFSSIHNIREINTNPPLQNLQNSLEVNDAPDPSSALQHSLLNDLTVINYSRKSLKLVNHYPKLPPDIQKKLQSN